MNNQYVGYWSLNHTDSEGPQVQLWKSKRPNIIHRFFNMYLLGTIWFDEVPQSIQYQEGPKFESVCPENCGCEEEPDGYIIASDDEDEEPQVIFK